MMKSPLIPATRRAACVLAMLAAGPCLASLQSPGDAPVATKIKSSCRVNVDASTDCLTTMHYDILTASARDVLSKVEIPSSSRATQSLVDAYVIERDGTRVRLPKGQIVRTSGQGPDQGVDNSTTTTLLFQGITVGSAIEYTTKRHGRPEKGISEFLDSVELDDSRQRYDSLHAEYTAEKPFVWRSEGPTAFEVKASEGGKKIVIDLIKPFYFGTVNETNFTVRKHPRIDLSSSDKLEDHFDKLVANYNRILSAPLPPQAAAEVLRLKNMTREEQIRSSVDFIGKHYRYLADYRLDDRGHTPLSLATIEKNGYGDCKDLTTLLTAMLRSLGIDAEPALVWLGDSAPTLLIPGTNNSNHVIVRVAVDGKAWWVDATSPVLLPGYTPTQLQDRWAIVLGKDGKPRLDTIPLAEATVEASTTEETQFHPDGTSDSDTSTLFNGAQLLALMSMEHDQGANAVDQAFCTDNKKCIVTRPAKVTPPYQVKIHSPEQPADSKHEGKYSMSLGDYFEFALNELKSYRATGGIGDLNVSGPMIREVSRRISGIKLSRTPNACHVRSRWGDYDAEFRQEANGVVAYKLRAFDKVAWIPHDDLMSDEFGKFLEQAEACYEGLTFSYTTEPSGK
ncbi:transglutaminase-like domain-containing protein [Dyella sp. LX-66]|uniref:transglutaminase domain-containing protein n=1 Tax=unclassified Dyella TaxID=2634549 RepID=UPI001BDF7DD8|nr:MULTISPECIES: DUF3857 domain-containing protein [unclassified Dyella]MBT2115471.1 transglutaminase-like domain-containing protein [Dyella sp. LX-1]MBT2139286.1 transglutaminase-like domain-containing protein [Dyella sp. LX-66]